MELTDEETRRLIEAANDGTGYFHMGECKAVSDIEEKVYEAMIQQIVESYRDDPDLLGDLLSWDDDLDPETITDEGIRDFVEDSWPMGVNFPEELQLL